MYIPYRFKLPSIITKIVHLIFRFSITFPHNYPKLLLFKINVSSARNLPKNLVPKGVRNLIFVSVWFTQYVYPVWQPVVDPRPVGVGEPRLGPRDQSGLVTPAEGLGLRPAEGLRRYQESLPFNRPIVPVDLYIHVKVQDCQRHSVHSSS